MASFLTFHYYFIKSIRRCYQNLKSFKVYFPHLLLFPPRKFRFLSMENLIKSIITFLFIRQLNKTEYKFPDFAITNASKLLVTVECAWSKYKNPQSLLPPVALKLHLLWRSIPIHKSPDWPEEESCNFCYSIIHLTVPFAIKQANAICKITPSFTDTPKEGINNLKEQCKIKILVHLSWLTWTDVFIAQDVSDSHNKLQDSTI
jgi:hypothetical protein